MAYKLVEQEFTTITFFNRLPQNQCSPLRKSSVNPVPLKTTLMTWKTLVATLDIDSAEYEEINNNLLVIVYY